ncbi:peptide-binding protein [Luteimonas viscosa]|uniref:Peptide-binding protein n=1 Tax=Luteimonas viscosa TaxID=1132694 RepID=A0A5D4XSW2_9GAMM|nr:SH3 domain-containing protein [Luteimonas viscosa]TYT27075.1 peptide-binding protein [Luteimonas viscosa]
MARARATSVHRAPDRPALRIGIGDRVVLGERDDEWPQFVWATATGIGGWIPATLFDAEHGPATALAAYDTTELDVDPGEPLVLHHELADWWWVENTRGARGWVPARKIERID